MSKLIITNHAITRSRERLDVKGTDDNVSNTLRQWFTRSVFKGRDNGDGVIYDNHTKDIRFVCDKDTKVVKTVYRLSTVYNYNPQMQAVTGTPKLTVDHLVKVLKREGSRISTQYRREIRKLTERRAELNVLVAELDLNFIRCDAPHNKKLIQSRIKDAQAQIDVLAREIDEKTAELQRVVAEVASIVGE